MNKTDKQALSLMSFFAILMIASVVMPAEATTPTPVTQQDNAPHQHVKFGATKQCLIGSNINNLLNLH